MRATILAIILMVIPLTAAAEGTCEGDLTTDQSGEWGSIDFDVDEPELELVVNEGFEVMLCVKAGSAQQGLGPEESGPYGEGEYEVSHSSNKELSHFGFSFRHVPDDTTTTTIAETTTTTVDNTTTTSVGDTTTTVGDTTTTTAADTTTTTVEDTTTTSVEDSTTTTVVDTTTSTPEELPFTGIPVGMLVSVGSLLLLAGVGVIRR